MTVSRTGSTPTPFGFVGAQGYQSDADSGLQLLGNRLYDPSVGRFISSDPAKAGTNWFSYCHNNPLFLTDPTGLIDGWRLTGGILAGIGGTIIGGPVGGAIAIGVFEGLYEYGKTGDPGHSIGVGAESGVGAFLAGEMLKAGVGLAGGGLGSGFIGGGEGGAGDLIGEIGGEGPCFVKGTPIQMGHGHSNAIEKIKKGDRVFSKNPKSGAMSVKSVVRSFVHRNSPTLKLRLDGGEEITTTPNHRFFVSGKGFVPAGRLAVGGEIVTRVGRPVKVLEIERHSPPATVYNFEVADNHTYFVGITGGGLFVHNDCGAIAREMQRRLGGGAIVRIKPKGGPWLDPPDGARGWPENSYNPRGEPWAYHDVFVKRGKVYDKMLPGGYKQAFRDWWSR